HLRVKSRRHRVAGPEDRWGGTSVPFRGYVEPPLSQPGPIPRRRRRRSGWKTTWLALVLALLAHVAFVGLLLVAHYVSVKCPGGDRQKPKPQAVTLGNIDPRAWAKNRGPTRELQAEEKRAEARKPEEKKKEDRPQGQVVDVAPGNEQESPDAKFLAEK